MHIGSIIKMKYFVDKYLRPHSDKPLRILDVGSQDVNGSYRELFENIHWNYIGCDMAEGKNVDIVLKDVYDWREVSANSMDVVVTGQTFEHIEYPWITIMEITRVLKPGGLCCIIAPAGGPEHKYPLDCWRIYPDGFRALAKYASLAVLEVFTEWNGSYPDQSEIWQDSVMIAKKNVMTDDADKLFQIKNTLSKLSV